MDPSTRRAVNASTRIAAGDDRTRYDRVAMGLHWLTVFLVLANFALALTWDGFPRPTHHLMVVTHMSFGVLLTGAVIARIGWRLIPGHQMPPATVGLQELAAKAVHYLVYGLLLAEGVLGFVLRWTEGRPMSFFVLQIPSPLTPISKAANGEIGEIHEWVGYAIVILAAGHAAAALYHHVVVKDDVLRRMLPGGARAKA